MPVDDPRRKFYEVDQGFNMKGCCSNLSCISAKYKMQKEIWIKMRYGIFDIGQMKYRIVCPACNTKMDPTSFY